MKKTLFLVHDPGGYDVIYPIVERFQQEGLPFDFFCLGPAALINPLYAQDEKFLNESLVDRLVHNQLICLVTGTSWGNFIEPEAIRLVKSFGLPTFSCIDYWSNYALRFHTKGEYVFPDYCMIMDDLSKAEAIADGIPQDILHVLGHPGLDALITQQSSGLRTGMDQANKQLHIIVLSQPIEQLYGNYFGYTESIVLEHCARLAQLRPEYSFKVKFHPKDEEAIKLQYAFMSVHGDLMEILNDFDLVIGMSTMGLLQAFIYGKPVISYQPNLQKMDMCITNKLGLSTCLKSFEQLLESLDAFYHDDSLENKMRTIPNHLIWRDGKSTDRIYIFIRKVLGL
jgi:hypothetical protein